MSPDQITRFSALARVGFGLGLAVAPERLLGAWIGRRDARRPGPQVLARALGIRDLAIGAGTLAADGGDRRRWLLGALAGDAADLVVTLAAGDDLPLRGRVLVAMTAAGGVALDAVALRG